MPCSGPGPVSESQVTEAFEDVIILLKNKYGLLSDVMGQILPPGIWEKDLERREELKTKLRSAIKEFFVQDSYESW